jgi:hypothetical protein
MIRISFKTEPFWLDLPHGVRLLLRPPGTAVILAAGTDLAASAANSAAVTAAASSAADPVTAPATGAATTPETGPDAANPPNLPGVVPADGGRLAFTCAVARAAILDWDGVADPVGKPLPVSPTAIDALLAHWPVFAAFERLYVQPALLVVAEGNA